jgi:1,2-diacylglycerol 3-beta-glucosyltransferase
MLYYVALALLLLYIFLLSSFLYGLTRSQTRKRATFAPTVSVIVSARNEERTIHRSMESLARLDYSPEKLEIILVDDQSNDRTFEIMDSFATRQPHFKAIQVSSQIAHLKGKANAIAHGIDESHGEVIFLTDADCIVPERWLKSVLAHYAEGTGLVAGFTLLESSNWFQGMQSLDWALLHTIAAGAVGVRRPLSCFGNNLSFLRRAYDEVGGYRDIPFSVTEDFALFRAITNRSRWDYSYVISPEALVISLPCKTISELLSQKRRWVAGGLDLRWPGFLMLGLGWMLNVLLLLLFFAGQPAASTWALWAGKIVMDAVFLGVPLKKLRSLSGMRFFPAFEVYYFVYVLALPILVMLGSKVAWKGRVFYSSDRNEKAP